MAGVAALGLSVLVFLGWGLHLPRLVAPFPGWPCTTPTTALLMAVLGGSLLAIRGGSLPLWPHHRWGPGLALLLVLWNGASYAFQSLPSFGSWFLSGWVATMPEVFPRQTSLSTLLGLGVAALCLLLLSYPGKWKADAAGNAGEARLGIERATVALCLAGSAIPWFLVMGYSNHATEIVTQGKSDIGSAPFTVLAMVALYLGIWSLGPSALLSRLWSGKTFAGQVMHWVLPFNLLMPIAFSHFEYLLKAKASWSANFTVAVVWSALSVFFLAKAIFLVHAIHTRDNTIARMLADKEKLIGELEATRNDLAAFNAKLEARVTEVTRNLVRSNMELQQFAYIAAHDLQAPLRSIAGYVQLLQRRYMGNLDDTARDLANKAVRNVATMRDMVNSVLEYSHLDAKASAFTRISLHIPLGTALDALQSSIEETGARIEVGDLPQVSGDAAQLAQVFQNLIANALKYRSESRPRVKISAQAKDGETEVAIKDNGLGIGPEYHAQIFKMFKRLNPENVSGKGMGLAICSRVIDRHGGRIWVESQPGDGSCFYFTVMNPNGAAP